MYLAIRGVVAPPSHVQRMISDGGGGGHPLPLLLPVSCAAAAGWTLGSNRKTLLPKGTKGAGAGGAGSGPSGLRPSPSVCGSPMAAVARRLGWLMVVCEEQSRLHVCSGYGAPFLL